MFGVAPQDRRYEGILNQILSLNPQIQNFNHIRAGDSLRLGFIPQAKAARVVSKPELPPGIIEAQLQNTPTFATTQVHQKDIENFWMLSWLAQNSNYLTIPGGIALETKGNLLSPGNINLISSVGDHYANYKAGIITKGRYDYLRKLSLDRLRSNIGPFEKMLFGQKTPHKAIRIARGGGIPANANIVKHTAHLNKLATLGKVGGYALIGVGATASCMQIAATQDNKEKNEILVETVVSTTTGLLTGAMVSLFLVSNPIGWGTALVIAAGTTAASYAAGKAALYAYDLNGNKVDFVNGTGVGRLCQ